MSMQRRDFLRASALAAAAGLAGCAGMHGSGSRGRVVVVGGGYGGATAAKYVRLFDPSIEVVLVEPNEAFISCPISNLVLGGFKTLADGYDTVLEVLGPKAGMAFAESRGLAAYFIVRSGDGFAISYTSQMAKYLESQTPAR